MHQWNIHIEIRLEIWHLRERGGRNTEVGAFSILVGVWLSEARRDGGRTYRSQLKMGNLEIRISRWKVRCRESRRGAVKRVVWETGGGQQSQATEMPSETVRSWQCKMFWLPMYEYNILIRTDAAWINFHEIPERTSLSKFKFFPYQFSIECG